MRMAELLRFYRGGVTVSYDSLTEDRVNNLVGYMRAVKDHHGA